MHFCTRRHQPNPPIHTDAGWPAHDPSPVLAVEVVGLLGTAQEQLRQLRQLAVEALQRLAQRPVTAAAVRQGSNSGNGSEAHVLVAAAGQRLVSLAGKGVPEGEARAELLALLQLLTEYAAAVPQPSVAAAVVRHCLRGFQALLGTLQAGGIDAAVWPAPAWQLLHALVPLLAAVCRRCEDSNAGRDILALLLGDQQAALMLAGAASHVLLLPEQQPVTPAAVPGKASGKASGSTPANIAQRSRMAALQRDLLQMFAALASLVGRQPACVAQPHHPRDSERAASRLSMSSAAFDDLSPSRDGRDGEQPAGPGQDLLLGELSLESGYSWPCGVWRNTPAGQVMLQVTLVAPQSPLHPGLSMRRGLTRRRALQFFSFLVSPHSGLAQRVLDHDPAPAAQPTRGAGLKATPPLGTPTTPASAATVRLRQGLLELLKAVFVAPGSPFASDKFVSGTSWGAAHAGGYCWGDAASALAASWLPARVLLCPPASQRHTLTIPLLPPHPSELHTCRLLHPLPLRPVPQALPQPAA